MFTVRLINRTHVCGSHTHVINKYGTMMFVVPCCRYLVDLYLGKKTGRSIISYFLKRVSTLRKAPPADMLWIEKEALPWVPSALERALVQKGIPIVVDYDDAHGYHTGEMPLLWR